MLLRSVVLLATSAVALHAVAADSGMDPDVRAVLIRHLKFSAAELADLDRGKVVRHSIETTAPGEMAVAGAVRVNVTRTRFLEHVRDIVAFKKAPEVLQVGRFSDPPVLEDLAALAIDASVFDPRACKVGACDVRLPAEAIRRVERALDLRAPDLQARGAALFKQMLLENVTAYVSGQGSRFAQFDGGSTPIRPLDEFAAMLKNSTEIGALVPGLVDHVRDFPQRRIIGAEDFLYWSRERFGMAPLISVTHITIVCATTRTCVVTSKNVYSSRYVDASLALTVATDTATPSAIYLVYANRSRANALKGSFSGLRRAVTERRTRAGVERNLRAVKIKLEKGS